METPIADFVQGYAASDVVRLHMPGHKGRAFLGCESMDITEVRGADALYEAEGIIARSERNAAALFGTAGTFYSTEGSSQCIRAMLYLVTTARRPGMSRTIVAARNVHRAFVYAAALLDVEVVWLWPEASASLCSCAVTAAALEEALAALDAPPAAVYVTSPDYLGAMAELPALAEVCHRHGTVLAVDDAHGAYLHFLPQPLHPLDLGADICCDSAHKTLPVLTGGAYLQIGKKAPAVWLEQAKTALAMFGSTSPSYLTLASLDLCNRYLTEGYPAHLRETAARLEDVRRALARAGWQVEDSDPLRLTLRAAGKGRELADRLRRNGVECEYADRDLLVLMATPENAPEELFALPARLGAPFGEPGASGPLPLARGEQVCSIRQALFAPREKIPAAEALGRICGAPTVGCPPAIPIAVSGERIGPAAMELFRYYGVDTVEVLKER